MGSEGGGVSNTISPGLALLLLSSEHELGLHPVLSLISSTPGTQVPPLSLMGGTEAGAMYWVCHSLAASPAHLEAPQWLVKCFGHALGMGTAPQPQATTPPSLP